MRLYTGRAQDREHEQAAPDTQTHDKQALCAVLCLFDWCQAHSDPVSARTISRAASAFGETVVRSSRLCALRTLPRKTCIVVKRCAQTAHSRGRVAHAERPVEVKACQSPLASCGRQADCAGAASVWRAAGKIDPASPASVFRQSCRFSNMRSPARKPSSGLQ